MKEVGVAEIFETDAEDTAVDVASLSDFDLLTRSLESSDSEAGKTLAEQLVASDEKLQTTYQEIEAYFGDEIISYHDYKGTALDVAKKCPAAQQVAQMGFEHFRDWVEANRTSEVIEVEAVEADDESAAEDTSDLDDKSTTKEAEVIKVVAQPKEKEVTAVVEQKKDLTPKEVELKPVPDSPQMKLEVVESSKQEVGAFSQKNEQTIEVKPATTVEKPVEVEVVSAPVEAVVVPDGVADEAVSTEPVVALEIKTPIESPVLVEVEEQNEFPVVLETKAVEPEVLATEEQPSIDLVEMAEVETELDTQATVLEEALGQVEDESLDEVERVDTSVVDTVYEYFESWSDTAKNEPPLEDFFIEMIDQLDDKTEADESKPSDILESTESESIEAQQDEPSFVELSEIELPENSQMLEAFDQQLQQEARIELVALLVSVKTARKTVDRLFEAKTKEECKMHVDELQIQLLIILQSLGYENAEVIVRDFLKSHSPQSLKSLINELEKSLRRAAYRTAHAKRAHREKTRHARLGKFIQFIMQAVASPRVTDLSAN